MKKNISNINDELSAMKKNDEITIVNSDTDNETIEKLSNDLSTMKFANEVTINEIKTSIRHIIGDTSEEFTSVKKTIDEINNEQSSMKKTTDELSSMKSTLTKINDELSSMKKTTDELSSKKTTDESTLMKINNELQSMKKTNDELSSMKSTIDNLTNEQSSMKSTLMKITDELSSKKKEVSVSPTPKLALDALKKLDPRERQYEQMIDIIHPIGSLMFRDDSHNPSVLRGYKKTRWDKLPFEKYIKTALVPGTIGGSDETSETILTVEQMPTHSHNMEMAGEISQKNFSETKSGKSSIGIRSTSTVGEHTHVIETTGNSEPHSHTILPNFVDVCVWKRIK